MSVFSNVQLLYLIYFFYVYINITIVIYSSLTALVEVGVLLISTLFLGGRGVRSQLPPLKLPRLFKFEY